MALNLDFQSAQILADVGATTGFTRSIDEQGNWGDEGTGTMYDPGMYTIGSNPRDAHELWANWPDSTDRMLLVNGFTNADQKVLEVSVPGTRCENPASKVTYTFGANMVNILPRRQRRRCCDQRIRQRPADRLGDRALERPKQQDRDQGRRPGAEWTSGSNNGTGTAATTSRSTTFADAGRRVQAAVQGRDQGRLAQLHRELRQHR